MRAMTDGRLGRSRAPFSGRPKGGAASAAGSHSQSPLRFDQSDGSPLSRSPPRPRTICGRGYAGSGVVSAETSLAHLVGMSASPDGLPHWVRRQVLAAGRWETTESSPRAEGEAARWLAAPAGKSRIARAQRATEAGSIILSAAVIAEAAQVEGGRRVGLDEFGRLEKKSPVFKAQRRFRALDHSPILFRRMPSCNRVRSETAESGGVREWCSRRTSAALACIYFSGKQKGKQMVPSTLRFRKFPGKTEGVWCSILETREFP